MRGTNIDDAYAAARERALARLRRGYGLGWRRPATRADVHDRESLRVSHGPDRLDTCLTEAEMRHDSQR